MIAFLLVILSAGCAGQRYTRTEYLHVRQGGEHILSRARATSGIVLDVGRWTVRAGFGTGYDAASAREPEAILEGRVDLRGRRWTWTAWGDMIGTGDFAAGTAIEWRY